MNDKTEQKNPALHRRSLVVSWTHFAQMPGTCCQMFYQAGCQALYQWMVVEGSQRMPGTCCPPPVYPLLAFDLQPLSTSNINHNITITAGKKVVNWKKRGSCQISSQAVEKCMRKWTQKDCCLQSDDPQPRSRSLTGMKWWRSIKPMNVANIQNGVIKPLQNVNLRVFTGKDF